MKHLIFLFALLISVSSFGQTQFSNGWKDGYKKGYCNNDMGCIDPIPPVPPIPPFNQSNISDYKFGYNEGFQAGLRANSSNSSSGQVSAPDYRLSDRTLDAMRDAGSVDPGPSTGDMIGEIGNAITAALPKITPEMYDAAAKLKAEGEGFDYKGGGLYTLQKTAKSDIVRYKKVEPQALKLVSDFVIENELEYEIISVEKQKVKVVGPSPGVNRCLVTFKVLNKDGSQYITESEKVEQVSSALQELGSLKSLKDDGLITTSEFDQAVLSRKSVILDYYSNIEGVNSLEDATKKLDQLKTLKNSNIITEEEYLQTSELYKSIILGK